MSYDKILVSIISILATFIQTESQLASSSLFDKHGWIMYTFYVVLFTYVVTGATLTVQGQAQNAGNDNHHGVLTKVVLMSGTLASSMLLLIIRQVLGWVALFFWTLYFLKIAYDQLVQVDAFNQFLRTLKNAFLRVSQNIKNALNAICGQTEDPVLPVSLPRPVSQ